MGPRLIGPIAEPPDLKPTGCLPTLLSDRGLRTCLQKKPRNRLTCQGPGSTHEHGCSSALQPRASEALMPSEPGMSPTPLSSSPTCPEKLALSPSPLSKTWKGHFCFLAGCQSLSIQDGGSLPGHLLERPKSSVSSPPRAVDAFLLSSGLSALGRFPQRLRPGSGAGGGCIPNSG